MKFTLGWLKEHLETTASAAEIADKLTMIGLEVEGVVDRAAALAAFTVAYVSRRSSTPMPTAAGLHRRYRAGEVQVVCGAPNARTGMKGVFAPPAPTFPAPTCAEAGKIRGVESCGMLCSEREMGLSDEHAGIIELPDDAPRSAPAPTSWGSPIR
jgi:phenylalanyl-tRNA synthetase beta chain